MAPKCPECRKMQQFAIHHHERRKCYEVRSSFIWYCGRCSRQQTLQRRLCPRVLISTCLPIPTDASVFTWRAAGKPALSNQGEPRTVRMIYYVAQGSAFRQETVDAMKDAIRKVQTLYAEQIRVHGFGEKTMRYETDSQGSPLVHVVNGDRRYRDHWDALQQIFEEGFDFDANVLLHRGW